MIRLLSDRSRPAVIIVGGHSRGVGKTSVVEHILRTRGTDERWVAVKVSAHRHATGAGTAAPVEEATWPSPLTQSGRYLAAGARRAFLCRAPDAHLPDTATFVRGLLAAGASVIVESNRIARLVPANLLLFVVSPSILDWKPSSGPCLTRADALVTAESAAAVPAAVAARGGCLDSRPVFEIDSDRRVSRLDSWLEGRLARPTVGAGRVLEQPHM